MIAKSQSALEDLLIALGLLDRPQLQPVPVRTNTPRDPKTPRRRRE